MTVYKEYNYNAFLFQINKLVDNETMEFLSRHNKYIGNKCIGCDFYYLNILDPFVYIMENDIDIMYCKMCIGLPNIYIYFC